MTKIILASELLAAGLNKTQIAERLGVSRRTVIRWSQAIEEHGSTSAFLEHYQQAKTGPRRSRKTDALLKRRIWALREKHHNCCGQKIQYFLAKDYGVEVSVTTIYKILAEKYQLRSKWRKNQSRGPVPKASSPREVLQIDSVHFGEVFAFTAVDIHTRESDVLLRPALEAADGQAFLLQCMERRFDRYVAIIQTDGGPEFKAQFVETAQKYCARHRIARPYKKNEQAFIESFNRSLRKECLGWAKYRVREIPALTQQVEDWLRYYHYERPHISLGMRPPLDAGV